ncbi:AraC family transcriptional regulator [Alteribacillus sp. HJP-4]|uniref:AraC family transcriptional regulator n=1 Tax=Alteribacillus sp. HJP-4 TaxID=2775394 RepID=UPI0035CD0986
MKEKITSMYWRKDHHCDDTDFPYHSHDRFEIYCFHNGNCKYVIGDCIYRLRPGDIIIMNGLTLHRPHPNPAVPYERSVIEFSREWIRPILKSMNIPELLVPFYKLNNFLFRDIDQDKLLEITNLIKKIDAIVKGERYSSDDDDPYLSERLIEARVSTLLTQLLFRIYELSRSQLSHLPPKESEKDRHVERVVTWIDQYFRNDISLSTIADSLNISKYHMCRIFKEVTGLTIMQYLNNCRINRAKFLLEMAPEKSILDVAFESGFENSSYFSRLFRQEMKMTPSEYRKRKSGRLVMELMEN